MIRADRLRRGLLALRNFSIFFACICFVITCCMMLFLNEVSRATGVVFAKESVEYAAKITFINIILLSVVCTWIDAARRRIMVNRPVRRLTLAAERAMQGDLSVRVEKVKRVDPNDGYNVVIDYFNRMIEELSGMETLRTDFIANVSHELKTPLAVMQNYAAMLQQPDLPEEKRLEYAGAIREASRRLADMVTNILKLNKLENQTIYPDARTYDLGEQLCECLLAFEKVWEEKQLQIHTEIEENVRIKADPELLALVWSNLFSNAVKFAQPGGSITVSLAAQGQDAAVRVTDTGCGIRPDVGGHIFEKFYQGDPSHATKGNGLGLALVKRVIDITHGNITVSSEVGKGSTFTVKLRREPDEQI